jgi:hypothetical protein
MMLAMYVADMETRCRDGKAPVCTPGARQMRLVWSDVKRRPTQSLSLVYSRAFGRLLVYLGAS